MLNKIKKIQIKSIIPKIKLILSPPKVTNTDEFSEFLYDFSTRAAGGIVLSYAQKRTGKLHFKLAKEKNYADDLIKAQIILHAEILSDLWFLTLEFLKLPHKPLAKLNYEILQNLHHRYFITAPTQTKLAQALKKRHFTANVQGIKELANKSGDILFKILPLTENLLDSNREVFAGQLRARYIGFLEKLDKRADKDSLITDLKKMMI